MKVVFLYPFKLKTMPQVSSSRRSQTCGDLLKNQGKQGDCRATGVARNDGSWKSNPLSSSAMSILVLALCGCSNVSETFDSTPGQGVGAKPITVVNHMINKGKLKGSALDQEHTHRLTSYAVGIGPAQRVPEKTMHIWRAPYIDGQGNLHEASRVRTVIQPSMWQTQPQVETGGEPCFND